MNRRAFLGGLAAAVSTQRAFPALSGPRCSFPKSPRERLAVASYPFREDLKPGAGKLKLLDFPQMVVTRFGVHGVEPLDEHFPSTDDAYLSQFRKSLAAAKAHVVNIPVGRLPQSFYDPDETKREQAIEHASKWIDVAAAIGSPSIRAHIRPVKGIVPDVNNAAASLSKVAAYGQKHNVIVNLENDDPASEDAFYIVDVLKAANTPWLRALPDFCNSMLLNKGVEYNDRAMEAMFERACNISHLKEIETDEGKTFRVDAAHLLQIAAKAGYRGYFSVEWDSEGDPYAGTEHLISVSLKALA